MYLRRSPLRTPSTPLPLSRRRAWRQAAPVSTVTISDWRKLINVLIFKLNTVIVVCFRPKAACRSWKAADFHFLLMFLFCQKKPFVQFLLWLGEFLCLAFTLVICFFCLETELEKIQNAKSSGKKLRFYVANFSNILDKIKKKTRTRATLDPLVYVWFRSTDTIRWSQWNERNVGAANAPSMWLSTTHLFASMASLGPPLWRVFCSSMHMKWQLEEIITAAASLRTGCRKVFILHSDVYFSAIEISLPSVNQYFSQMTY